jgi:hypothetical protein
MTNTDFENKLHIYDFNSILSYIINNYVKFLLLILVVIIIYIVDYICVINSSIYAMPSAIPGIAAVSQPTSNVKHSKKKRKQ